MYQHLIAAKVNRKHLTVKETIFNIFYRLRSNKWLYALPNSLTSASGSSNHKPSFSVTWEELSTWDSQQLLPRSGKPCRRLAGIFQIAPVIHRAGTRPHILPLELCTITADYSKVLQTVSQFRIYLCTALENGEQREINRHLYGLNFKRGKKKDKSPSM